MHTPRGSQMLACIILSCLLLLSCTPDPITDGMVAESGPVHRSEFAEDDDGPQCPLALYWEMEDLLLAVGGETPWICPPKPGYIGYSIELPNTEAPDSLTVSLGGRPPDELILRDYGPHCANAPLAVLADGSHGESAVLSIDPYADTCRLRDCTEFADQSRSATVTLGAESSTLSRLSQQRLEIRWTTTDGIPLLLAADGLDAEQILRLAQSVSLEPANPPRLRLVGGVAGFESVERSLSPGTWLPGLNAAALYTISGRAIQIAVAYDHGFSAAATYAASSSTTQLLETPIGPAVWIPEGGNFLMIQASNDRLLSIEGSSGLAEAVSIAEQLEFDGD